MIGAVTFDLWDTLVFDDSDEAARAEAGLPTKAQARRALFVDEVRAHHPGLSEERVAGALEAANDAFRHQWKVEHRTPHIRDRLRDALHRLDLAPTPGFRGLVDAYRRMEVEHPPDTTPHAAATLATLAERYPLAIISDAIVTPGAQLREMLAGHHLLHFFTATVFSDEAGAAKPAPAVFHRAAAAVGCPVDALVHVGDREANDIAGPHGVGARGVLYIGAVDRRDGPTTADAVCAVLAELPAILDRLQETS